MSQEKGSRSVVFSFRVLIIGIILCFVVSSVNGCITTKQVEEIVTKSNESMLISLVDMSSSVLPGAGLPSAKADGSLAGHWEEDAGKIDAFIAAHPGQEALASALRIRQALLFLAYGQYNLATASFEMANRAYLFTARDKAIYDLRSHLIWWFAQDKTLFYSKDFSKGSEALLEFQKIIATLKDSADFRDYLAEMHAYIALQMALRTTNSSDRLNYFRDGINQYTGIFTSEDLKLLLGHKDGQKVLLNNRRQTRAIAVIQKAREVSKGNPEIVKEIINPDFQNLLK